MVRARGVADVTRTLDDNAAATAWTRGRDLAFDDAMARARVLADQAAATPAQAD
jgi:hypothetical protein